MALHRDRCGDIQIDYPFGIGAGCYFDESFEVACDDDDSSGSPKVLLKSINLTVYPNFWQRQSLCTPFFFSERDNRFTAIGCDSYAQQYDSSSPGSGCLSICACDPTQNGTYRCDWSCTILPNRKDQEQVPVVLEWGNDKGSCYEEYNSRTEMCNKDNQCLIQIDSGHFCICDDSSSYASKDLCAGNLICNTTGGINCSECPHGYYPTGSNIENQTKCSNFRKALIFGKRSRGKFIAIGTWWLYNFVKRRGEIKLKQKFFKRNGGLLLHQELSSDKGGQGTIYKGMLVDGKIVVVKKSKIIDENKVEEFINEVVILSQINHRNIVKLLGCCLETEVPLLIYEFIPNGTLFEYIRHQSEEFPITWEMRLRIAVDVLGERSIHLTYSEEDKILAAYFLCAMKEGRPFEILDVHVLMEGGKDEIITVTKLAKRCFNLNSKKRPTMTEVVIELAGIRACNGVSNIVQESVEDIDCVDGGIAESSDLDACFTDSSTGSDSVDISMMSIL
ncbi:Wall-associated receptor kinase-like 8 [Citrus sinensis]|uniref:Wall-associated receptor kinase-like 8 n=1 Tax=Citrus sinensis TaxID=2711 RepID=A0ACB8JAL8_CITSI|nr:Wall-associated receptor kinase-like 8 [Citrus sinensis]